MLSTDAKTQVLSHKSGEMDLIQRNCNLSEEESLHFFLFFREFIVTI